MVTNLADPQQQYLKTRIETASQPQLLLMLFDAAVKKLHIAKRAIPAKEIEKAHTELTKVQRIFTELMVALDFQQGGEIAENLLRIYDFVYHHLVKANIKQDVKMIDEVLPIVEELRQGWTKAVEKFNEEREISTGTAPQTRSIGVIASQAAARIAKPAVSKPAPEEKQRPRLNIRG